MREHANHALPGPADYDVLIIDGRSGSGKTSLARQATVAARLAELDPQVLHVEDLYPGWDGLAAGSRALASVLERREYRRYDWIAGEFGERVTIGPELPLIIEGCGALTAEALGAAQRFAGPAARVLTLWLECPVPERQARALARDGETYAPHWQRWADQEDALYARTRPWLIAERIIASDSGETGRGEPPERRVD
ncbi:nucleoside/nucleotide kinase family protein [Leucobacter salsicius]|uniref:hypothetical protein n=1 Tax=Leucobacter salsicius TaxID=664638 RepID=UPI00034BC0FE|nr:hypothetical protein [Leucobacter salsicius]